jgi:hypothetical protein
VRVRPERVTPLLVPWVDGTRSGRVPAVGDGADAGLSIARGGLVELDDLSRVVLLGVVTEDVPTLGLVEKTNRDELFAELAAKRPLRPERHRDELVGEETVGGLVVPQEGQRQRPVAGRVEAGPDEPRVAVDVDGNAGVNHDQKFSENGGTNRSKTVAPARRKRIAFASGRTRLGAETKSISDRKRDRFLTASPPRGARDERP